MAPSDPDGPRTRRIQRGKQVLMEIELDAVQLEVLAGPDHPMRTTLFLPAIRLGTSPECDLVLSDPSVSRTHAALERREQGLMVRDLDSTNGTRLQGARIREAWLEPGGELSLGDTRIRVTLGTEARQALVDGAEGLGELVGSSPAMQELYGLIRAVAPTPVSVLVTGESGTGKELVARCLHQLSGRRGDLVAFDAGAVEPALLRSDLFGHVKGAFTGASDAREGAFRSADRGTLFLDEVGELPLELQATLLRTLESREVRPVGADRSHPVDVRVVAATHRDLRAQVRAGRFREDLFHRLASFPLRVPALRERRQDLPALVTHLASRFPDHGGFSQAALARLGGLPLPGNVRELRNLVERALILAGGGEVGPEHLVALDEVLDGPDGSGPEHSTTRSMRGDLASEERRLVEQALARNPRSQKAAAAELGISLAALKRRLARYRAEDAGAEAPEA